MNRGEGGYRLNHVWDGLLTKPTGGINTPRLSSDVSPTSVLSDVERKLVDHEIEVCTCAADRYPNNYNAWSHRSWLIQQFAAGDIQLLERELQATYLFVCRHVSDYSGFHHRQCLLEQLHKFSPEGSEVSKRLHDECTVTEDLIRRYVGHEAIWCHRRYVLRRLAMLHTTARCENCLQSRAGVFIPKKTKLESSAIDCNELLKKEESFCVSVMQETSLWQKALAEKHLTWLHRTCHQNNLM
ncbi:Protein prenyltransferase alpha subunit repeat-containing protein 1 [Lamellibrachia satsuma]|nr:Protein prenyltransferase alpha subunit repeat-containing protein 1 [Lamellibrachia satsuma]